MANAHLRAAKDVRRAAVVERQTHSLQRGHIGAQALEAGCVRAAEAVDGLIRIADDKEALPRRAPVAHEGALHGVDVLKLVYQQVVEASVGGHVRAKRVEQQIVQVARAQLAQRHLIGVHERLFDPGFRAGRAVFYRRNGAQRGAGRALAQFRQAAKDFQGAVFPQQGPGVEHLQAEGVESADVQRLGPARAEALREAFTKFPRRLIGERHRRYMRRLRPVCEQVNDALYEREGLARARPGDDRQRGGFRLHGAALLLVEAAVLARGRFPGGRLRLALARPDRDGFGLLGRDGHVEHRHLSAEHFQFSGRKDGNDAVFAVIAALAQHPARAQAADALFQRPPPGGADVAKGTFAQYVQFIAQRGKQREVALHDLLGGRGNAHTGGKHFGKRHQALERPAARRRRTTLGPVGQIFGAVLDADGQFAPTGGTAALHAHGLRRFQADVAGAVAVQVVLALLGEKFDGALETLARLDGAPEGRVTGLAGEQIGLARQLCRRMGVRVGDERAAVESGDAPVHRRVRRKTGLQGADVTGEVAETFLDGVKARESPQQGKVRRPDVRGDEHGLRACFQRHLQQVAAIQAENRPAVGMKVADALQPRGEPFRRFERRHEDDVVYLARAAVLLVNGADLGAEDKTRLSLDLAGQAQRFFQGKHALARRFQRF